MAAADSSNYIPLLVAILPAILSPIVPWVLGRSKVSKEAATIDYLNKRLDILERLNKLHTQLTEGPIRPFLDTEIEHCRTFLYQRPAFTPHDVEVAMVAPQSAWGRFFLTQPAVSVRKGIFKGALLFLLCNSSGLPADDTGHFVFRVVRRRVLYSSRLIHWGLCLLPWPCPSVSPCGSLKHV